MNNRCTFKQGLFNCGSYAFNLYKENIEQGDYCDHYYWEDQAKKAAAQEREACAKVCEPSEEHRREASWGYLGGEEGVKLLDAKAADIRARGTT